VAIFGAEVGMIRDLLWIAGVDPSPGGCGRELAGSIARGDVDCVRVGDFIVRSSRIYPVRAFSGRRGISQFNQKLKNDFESVQGAEQRLKEAREREAGLTIPGT
jgi:hypothetical protein